jgi:hypothetical protein
VISVLFPYVISVLFPYVISVLFPYTFNNYFFPLLVENMILSYYFIW